MKFREFLLRRLLKGTDYLVGYDASSGEYIRISKADLASSIAASAATQTLTVQYSANGSSWHDSYTAGDHYTRIKVGSGAWSGAIPLCVSAYDIWRQQNNSGDEADFLESLKGEPGEPGDVSGLRIQDMSDYAEFFQLVDNAIATATNNLVASVTEAVTTAIFSTLANKLDKDLSNLNASGVIADDSYIPVVTKSGEVVKVQAGTLAAYTGIKNKVESSSLETALKNQRRGFEISGTQDGSNRTFTLSSSYAIGTSALYLNGQRLYAGVDYTENSANQITFIGEWIPISGDSILFEAVPLSVDSITQNSSQNQ